MELYTPPDPSESNSEDDGADNFNRDTATMDGDSENEFNEEGEHKDDGKEGKSQEEMT